LTLAFVFLCFLNQLTLIQTQMADQGKVKPQLPGAIIEYHNGQPVFKCMATGQYMNRAYGMPSVDKNGVLSRAGSFISPLAAASYCRKKYEEELETAGEKAEASAKRQATGEGKEKKPKSKADIEADMAKTYKRKMSSLCYDLGLIRYDSASKTFKKIDGQNEKLETCAVWGPLDAHPRCKLHMMGSDAHYVDVTSEAAIRKQLAKEKKHVSPKPLMTCDIYSPGKDKVQRFEVSKELDDYLDINLPGVTFRKGDIDGRACLLVCTQKPCPDGQAGSNKLLTKKVGLEDHRADYNTHVIAICAGLGSSAVAVEGLEDPDENEEKISKKQAKKVKPEEPKLELGDLLF